MVGSLADKDSLKRETQDRVPISPEEDYVLKEIERIEGLSTRAKTWRWLLGNYENLVKAKLICEAWEKKKAAEVYLNGL